MEETVRARELSVEGRCWWTLSVGEVLVGAKRGREVLVGAKCGWEVLVGAKGGRKCWWTQGFDFTLDNTENWLGLVVWASLSFRLPPDSGFG